MLHITLTGQRTAFQPGDEIAGTATWRCAEPPNRVEICLGWHTSGKGTRDSETVATEVVPNPAASGQHTFRFTAPAQPHSFSGRLISLVWSVELIVDPSEEVERVEVVIAPDTREIELPVFTPPEQPLEQAGSFLKKLLSRAPQR